jgi:hypothetical protein
MSIRDIPPIDGVSERLITAINERLRTLGSAVDAQTGGASGGASGGGASGGGGAGGGSGTGTTSSVIQPSSCGMTETGPRAQNLATGFTYTTLSLEVEEPIGTATAPIPGTQLHVGLSDDGGSSWQDQGYYVADRVHTVGGSYYLTTIRLTVVVLAGTTSWMARVYALGDSADPGWDSAIVSPPLAVAGLGLASATLISTLNVVGGAGGSFPYNVITPDGTQYFDIGDFSYDDTPCVSDPYAYFVRVTLQDLDAGHGACGPEQAFSGFRVMGTSQHTGKVDGGYGLNGYGYVRAANIAYVRARLYVCNALDGSATSFTNSACARLQTGIGGGAGFIDILVAAGGATPDGLIQGTRVDPSTMAGSMGHDPNTGGIASRGNPQSILNDYDFEQSNRGGSPAHSAWLFAGTCEIKQDGTAYSGLNYCRLTNANSNCSQQAPCRAGETLYVGLYARSSNSTPGVGEVHSFSVALTFLNGSGTQVSTVYVATQNGYVANWTLSEGTALIPGSAVAVLLQCYVNAAETSGGYWDFDAVRCEPQIRAGNLRLSGPVVNDGSGGTTLGYDASTFGLSANQLIVNPGGITTPLLHNQAVDAAKMGVAAITAANLALDANSVVDANVQSVGVAKLIAGSVIFTGNVALSRGSGNPVIELDNTGMFLFSQASGSAGLTSQPYVAIQSGGISLFQGSTARSVTVTSTGVTLWMSNGSTSSPFCALSASGTTISDGAGNSCFVGSGFLQLTSGANTAQLNSSGLGVTVGSNTLSASAIAIQLANATQALAVTAGAITLYYANGTTAQPYVQVASTGVTIADGAGHGLVLTASNARLYSVLNNTSFPYVEATSSGGGGVSIIYDSNNSVKATSGAVTITSHGVSTSIIGNTLSTGILQAAQVTTSALVFAFGSALTFANSQYSGSASTGSITAPATVAGYITVFVTGLGIYKIPIYNN